MPDYETRKPFGFNYSLFTGLHLALLLVLLLLLLLLAASHHIKSHHMESRSRRGKLKLGRVLTRFRLGPKKSGGNSQSKSNISGFFLLP